MKVYGKLTDQKATVVDGDKAEILDLAQLLFVKVSFEAKLAQLNEQIAELRKIGVSVVLDPVEPGIEPLEPKKE